MKKLLLAAVAVSLFAADAYGQLPVSADPGRSERTRSDLESTLLLYQEYLQSPAYSRNVKASVRADADRIRARLEFGDFRLGDRIVLDVQGEAELPDTVAVQAGPMITLPLFGDISLVGVLRSEIQGHLTEELGAFIRDPVVRARGLMRVSIQGDVRQPGFYVVPADMLVGEALMVAGGPGATANLDGLRIERGSEVISEGEELQEARRVGLTLDQLNLHAGDQIVMPSRGGGFLPTVGLIAGLVGSSVLILLQVTR